MVMKASSETSGIVTFDDKVLIIGSAIYYIRWSIKGE